MLSKLLWRRRVGSGVAAFSRVTSSVSVAPEPTACVIAVDGIVKPHGGGPPSTDGNAGAAGQVVVSSDAGSALASSGRQNVGSDAPDARSVISRNCAGDPLQRTCRHFV